MHRLWVPRPRRAWWLLDTNGTVIWDYWTHRAARRTADRLNAAAVARGTVVRYRVERMP